MKKTFIIKLLCSISLLCFLLFIRSLIPYHLPFWAELIIIVIFSLVPFMITFKTLNIKSAVVGNGQHGTSRWQTPEEKHQFFQTVPFGKETVSGMVVGVENNCWLVDSSDQSLMLNAPPGAGKSTCVFLPNIEYNINAVKNAHAKISMVLTDCKGDLYRKTKIKMEQAGIKTCLLDFRNPLYSLKYNLMYNINTSMKAYKTATTQGDKIKSYALAEKYAKILSNSIVCSLDTNDRSEAGEYFKNTAQGLITALLLLVAEYGEEPQQHIISVFRLIIELNGLEESSHSSETIQKSKMEKLLTLIDNDRLKYYAGASIKADVRTSMNIFSTALNNLANFIDIELEQMICGHSEEISSESFVDSPHAIFLVCPDENTTRHFFASLFIRSFSNELINLAETKYRLNGGRLPCDFFYYLDEFGQMPPIKDVSTIFTAIRSRGGRIIVGLQSLAQLEQKYSHTTAKIIKDACQMFLLTYLSPLATDTAKSVSETLGTQTVLSGSVTSSDSKVSSTRNMMSRPLLYPHEITFLGFGNFVLMKSGTHPIKTKLPYCYNYLEKPEEYNIQKNNELDIIIIDTLSISGVKLNVARSRNKLTKGMFDN